MRILMALALLVFCVTPAHATPVNKEMANSFFNTCTQSAMPYVSDETKQYMCACQAAKMQENLTIEDIKSMAQQSQAGRNATNKMILNVYAPCIEYPARDYHYTTCMNDPKNKNLTSNPQGLCACSANQIATYLRQNAQKEFTRILNRTPNVTDPMTALYNDPAFMQFAQGKLMACIR